jgi:hypothetical protein
MRAHHWAVGAFVAVALGTCATAQEGEGKKAGKVVYETPEAVFKAAAAALKKEDWKAYCACLTPSSRDELAGIALLTNMQRKGEAEMFAAKAAKDVREKIKAQLKPLNDLFAKYGITEDKLKALPRPKEKSDPKDKETQRKMVRKLATSLIKDRCAFVGDIMALEKKLSKKKKAAFDPGKLVDVKITGDTATGTAVSKIGGEELRFPMRFRKGPSGWRIEMVLAPGGKKPPKKFPKLSPPPPKD